MDPDANLAEQPALAVAILEKITAEPAPAAGEPGRLAELVIGLDGWLVGVGWRPRRWRRDVSRQG